MKHSFNTAWSLSRREFRVRGFSLVELLVAMAVMSLMMVCLVTLTDQTSRLWRRTSGQIETFRAARTGYEAMTRQISQATLNTYQDLFGYASSGSTTLVARTQANASTFIPVVYQRQSELRFICGPSSALIPKTWSDFPGQITPPLRPGHCIFFQSTAGYTETGSYNDLDNLINTRGYYVEYTSGVGLQPGFLTSGSAQTPLVSNRFRLMELVEPSELFTLYANSTGKAWFQNPLAGGVAPAWSGGGAGAAAGRESYSRVVAENIVAMVLLPKIAPRDAAAVFPSAPPESVLAPHYSYDSTVVGEATNYSTDLQAGTVNSKNQLPPIIQVTMVAIDQASADRLNVIATQQGRNPVQVLGLNSLFCNLTDQASALQTDLQTLETNLRTNHLTYRLFTSDIMIQSAKWSNAQKN